MHATAIAATLLAIVTCTGALGAQELRASGPFDLPLVLEHVTVVDVEHGVLLHDRSVEVTGTRITAVDSGRARRAAARLVDASGKFVVPGLWDMHLHVLQGERRPPDVGAWLRALLAAGVTGVRDAGSLPDTLLAVRARLNRDSLLAPRLLAPGPVLDGPPDSTAAAPDAWIVRTPDGGRRAVDVLARAGVDYVMIQSHLGREAYLAVADQAKRRGIVLAGPVPAAVTALEAADAGQRSLEHLEDVAASCATGDAAPRAYDHERCRALFRALARHGTWLTPTLARVPRPALEPLAALVALASAEGVPILAGTDGGSASAEPGASLHDELALLVHGGLTPAAALRAATLEPARFLAAADTMGTVAAGRVADLVLLDADPLADIRSTTRVHAVVANGRWIDRASIDAMLARTVRAAAR